MATLVLAGCGGTPASPVADSRAADSTPTPDPAASAAPSTPSASASPDDAATEDATPDGAATSENPPTPAEATNAPSASPSSTAQPEEDDTSPGDATSPELEMPEAPEPAVTSLSDLLEDVDVSPLVRAPLPRAASRRGGLVAKYPHLLRPARAARVQSSSISPSGDRLQVSLVANTSLDPEQVLLAYRTRLPLRGLVEQDAPAATAGSTAASFRRGRSVVTLTVTPQGSRTSYSILASLHTGGS